MQDLDSAILDGLNAVRSSHGLRPLVLSADLEHAAVAHSRAMLEGGFFDHVSPDGTTFAQRVKRYYSPAGYANWSAGENIVYSTAALDAATAVKAWMQSPPHRKNMLDPEWREVGIGSMHAASAGGAFGGEPTWVITMDFGARTGGGTTAKPVAAVRTPSAKSTTGTKAHKAATRARNTGRKAQTNA